VIDLTVPAGIFGCTDPTACNYDSLATCDDASCLPVPTCNTDPCAGDVEWIDPAGDPCLCVIDLTVPAGIFGCTDPTACNYDLTATCDDNSCDGLLGCMNTTACNYDPLATCDDEICYYLYGSITPNGNTLFATFVGNPPYSYSWSTGENSPSITPIINGLYWCEGTDNNQCVMTLNYNVVDLPNALINLAIHNLLVYPNPTNTLINIKFNSVYNQRITLRLFNTISEIIYEDILKQSNHEYATQINLKDYPKGIYFLEIETNDGIINKKVILQ